MTSSHSFNRRLAAYRNAKGIKQDDLSRAMGFSDRQSLSAIETGQRSLSADELMKALNFLQVTFDEFSDQYSLIGEASYSWRKKDATSADITSFEKVTNRIIALYRELHNEYATTRRSVILPKLPLNRNSNVFDAQECAEKLVAEFNLGDFPAETLEEKLFDCFGVVTFYVDAPTTVSGAAIKLDALSVILINRSEAVGRRNFDIAHEAFHCLTWDALPPSHEVIAERSGVKKAIEEKLADAFASALLMPASSIEKYFPSHTTVNEDVINSLADKFGVTSKALLWRLLNLNKISSSLRDQLDNNLIVNNGNKNKVCTPFRLNKSYALYIQKALQNGVISVRKMASTLGMPIESLAELLKQYNLPIPFDL